MRLGAVLAALLVGVVGYGAADAWARPVGLRDLPRVPRAAVMAAHHVSYHGGPVLHSNRTHVIFWQPRGSGLRFGPGYMPLVQGFFRNVAAASHSTSNVFGLTGQYTDYTGRPAAYASRYGGSVLDSDPLPTSGCIEPPSGPLWTSCLTDSQLQAELEHVVRVHGLPHRRDDVYFLVMPRGLASCMSSTPGSSCALGGPVNGYCGYHGVTNDGRLLYAVIPYNAVPGHCQSTNPRPNHNAADPALSTISHELSELITDPEEDAWYDSSQNEIGDICLTRYGPALGGSGVSRFNESINGGHYYLQEEWSNAANRCRPRAHPDHASFSVARRAGHTVTFRATASSPAGVIRSFHWRFGDGATGRGRHPVHSYRHPGSYVVRLSVIDSWDNRVTAVATIQVG